MISIQEMTAWTARDIEQAIHAARPPSWRFKLEVDQGVYAATFTNAEGNVVWTLEGFDARLTLFDAYGWLQRRQLPRTNPVWNRRGEIRRPSVGPMSLRGVLVPDPQDLDPAEIEVVVYEQHLSRRK